jgi:UMF1 family MFS transporter
MISTTSTTSTWTSAFDASCWVSPLYMSTSPGGYIIDEEEENIRTPQQIKEDDEVLGWTLDAAARGVVVIGTAVFVSSELLKLAKEAAGCQVDFQEEEEWIYQKCSKRVYGMKPTSILTNIVMIVGLCSAITMPLIGSLIDHTNYRRAVGSLSAAVMAVFILLQMLVLPNVWFAAILQVLIAFSYKVHLCAVYAYLPELTLDHGRLVQYTAQFVATQYSASVIFLIFMVVILSWFNRNDQFSAATLSQTVVFIITSLFLGYAWTRLFRTRKASQQVPEGKSLLYSGFWKIYKSSRDIALHHSAIKWFLVAAAFAEAATTTFSTIAITYMTEQLNFDARQNGVAILILLLFGVPGTRLAAWLTNIFNPVRSLQACLLLWIVNTTAASIFLKEPNQQGLAYFFAMIWGLAIGWVYPTEKVRSGWSEHSFMQTMCVPALTGISFFVCSHTHAYIYIYIQLKRLSM